MNCGALLKRWARWLSAVSGEAGLEAGPLAETHQLYFWANEVAARNGYNLTYESDQMHAVRISRLRDDPARFATILAKAQNTSACME